MICVFISKDYLPYVTNIKTETKATGFAKVIGNKGGVAITFRVYETSFCFISSHLAAKPDKMPLRK